MNLPENNSPVKEPTEWELAMSKAMGIPVEGLRVDPNNPFILSKEQREIMKGLVTPGSKAEKLFAKGEK